MEQDASALAPESNPGSDPKSLLLLTDPVSLLSSPATPHESPLATRLRPGTQRPHRPPRPRHPTPLGQNEPGSSHGPLHHRDGTSLWRSPSSPHAHRPPHRTRHQAQSLSGQ